MSAEDPSYTVFIRLPFPRGDFVDPPAVEWNAAKDKALWKILSKASKNSVIDWSELATKFEVTLAFLLQQAAWLYERQLLQVKAQMRKVGASKGSAASPVPPGSITESGGEAMRRTGSGGPRVPSSLSTRKDSPVPKADGSTSNASGKPLAPPFSRTSSANTIPSRQLPPQNSPRLAQATLPKRSLSPPARKKTVDIHPDSSSSTEESLSESSSDSGLPAQSRLLRRPPRFSSQRHGVPDDPDDDDEGPAFMPFAASSDTHTHHDPSETLRDDPRNISRRLPSRKNPDITQHSQTSDSSASSAALFSRVPSNKEGAQKSRPAGPLSPRRTAELAGRSSGRGKTVGRQDSDGTPSMGSSFSDLDDASVTQSALEEALASNMQAGGGMASRMSSISQALRSKYL
ncbi:hypothetical protein BP5796_10732 [Coleophoma crateriformis]|uniref:Autophagy-related protein 29 n=1 Tax=Coleophoma crateriformis TaxID=565419 RepID=A0A3D8QRG5_9HELO|nr:hypothetical protein BP5796_10732 [Coleophoma crateriformis]